MFELQTERLRLIALDVESLRLSLEDPRQMEKNLGLQTDTDVLEGEMRIAVEQMLTGVAMDEVNCLWYTHWQIVLKEENRSIGGFCFKGPPSETGEVEVGYGIEPQYQGKGYMSEALEEILRWALEQPGVSAVLSETEKLNITSQRVLQNAGFAQYRQTEGCLWWRICRE